MTDETPINTGQRLLLRLVTILLVIAVGTGGLWVLARQLETPPPSQPLPEISELRPLLFEEDGDLVRSGWIMAPATPPPGGWESPWGIDVFLLPGRVSSEKNLDAWLTSADDASIPSGNLTSPLLEGDAGTILYVPRLRTLTVRALEGVDRADDLALLRDFEALQAEYALDSYLAAAALERGLILAGDGMGVDAVLRLRSAILQGDFSDNARDDVPLEDRFIGTIIDALPSDVSPDVPFCTGVNLAPDCVVSWPQVQRLLGGEMEADIHDYLSARMSEAGARLDANVRKPAPPLPAFETIELAPIARPGE